MRKALELAALTLSAAALSLFIIGSVTLFLTGNHAAGLDFISYWSAGRLLTEHGNPYSPAAVHSIQTAAGYPSGFDPLIMRNPPPGLLLALPFGSMGLRVGVLLWSILLLAALLFATWLLWSIYGRHNRLAFLAGASFGPALICLLTGQSSILAALGYALLLAHYRKRPFAAGMALWLCALKPHLFLPSALVFLLWSRSQRIWKPICGLLTALAFSTAIALWFDPTVFAHYLAMLHSSGITSEYLPCLAIALRDALPKSYRVAQYLPALAGCCWAAIYFYRNREHWSHEDEGNIVLLVSVNVAPYAWVTDQAVLLPAIIAIISASRDRSIALAAALLSAVIELQVLLRPNLHSPGYLWTAPAWLIFALWVRRRFSDQKALQHPQDLSYAPSDVVR